MRLLLSTPRCPSVEVPHRAQLRVAPLDEFVHRHVHKFPQRGDDGLLHRPRRRGVVLLRPARRLLHDLVDDAQPLQVARRDLERRRRLGRLRAVAPQDARAALGGRGPPRRRPLPCPTTARHLVGRDVPGAPRARERFSPVSAKPSLLYLIIQMGGGMILMLKAR